VWPLSDDISGDAPNAWYWVQRALDDYWRDVMGVAYETVPNLSVSVNRANTTAFYRACGVFSVGGGPPGYVEFASQYARYRSAVEHELGHHLMRNQAQQSLYRVGDGDCTNDPQVCGLDEGLADYFTAAFDDNPAIYPYVSGGVFYPWSLRNLSRLTKLHTCDGTFHYTGDAHVEGAALGGALWDWRQRLIDNFQVAGDDVDRAVFDAVRRFRLQDPYDPTLRGFRMALHATTLGGQRADDLDWAFDRHNIKITMDNDVTCPVRPLLERIDEWVAADGRHTHLSWTRVPGASHYRIAAHRFASTAGLELGEIVADGLLDTSYVHVESDTTLLDAFLVAAVDDSGDVITASDETPAVTAVGPGLAGSSRPRLEVFPNPTRSGSVIRWASPGLQAARVRVFDVLGRLVRVISPPAGSAETRWDGRDTGGRSVPSGVYVVVVDSGRSTITKRVVMIR
jgi:hypothetical protein